MSTDPRVPPMSAVREAFVRAHPFSHTTDVDERFAEFDRFIAKVRADALREFAAKDIPAAVEARRTLLAEADEIEREARDGE